MEDQQDNFARFLESVKTCEKSPSFRTQLECDKSSVTNHRRFSHYMVLENSYTTELDFVRGLQGRVNYAISYGGGLSIRTFLNNIPEYPRTTALMNR